jgi:hypothetical protein
MNRQHIISEIKRTAEENGGVPLGKDQDQDDIKYLRSIIDED